MELRPSPLEVVDVDRLFWRNRRVLITGHTGFKGAWLALTLEKAGAELWGLALPSRDEGEAFAALKPWPDLVSFEVDLRDEERTQEAIDQANPEIVFHLAAQAYVRTALAQPSETFGVNVLGTAHLLSALQHAPDLKAVVVATTDKVYQDKGIVHRFREEDPLGAREPYASSKVCTEIAVRSFASTYFDARQIPLGTVRAGNVIGGGDWGRDRLVPDAMRALAARSELLLRHPEATRPWQFVLDVTCGYLSFAKLLAENRLSAPLAINLGPVDPIQPTVGDVINKLVDLWGEGTWRLERPGDDVETIALALDPSLAEETIGWHPAVSLETALEWTVEWHKAQQAGEDMRSVSLGQVRRYLNLIAADPH